MEILGHSRVCTPEEFQAIGRLPHAERGCCPELRHQEKEKGANPMRVNVYAEELTEEVKVVSKTAEDTGITHVGVRVYLDSPSSLQATEADDDRSAVTFWLPGTDEGKRSAGVLRRIFEESIRHLGNITP